MENFKKHIYKDSESHTEKEYTHEQIEYSEEIAKNKLEKILNPNFNDFAVRYMNIEEYKKLIETGNLSGEFILSEGVYYKHNSFSDFLNRFSTVYEARDELSQTMWEKISGITTLETGNLINQIKYIEINNKDKTFNEKQVLIRDYLLHYMNSHIVENLYGRNAVSPYVEGVPFHSDATTLALNKVEKRKDFQVQLGAIDFIPKEDVPKLYNEFLDYITQSIISGTRFHVDYPEKEYAEQKAKEYGLDAEQTLKLSYYFEFIKDEFNIGKENLKTIQDFKNNPDFLSEKDGLRRIITALGNINDWLTVSQSRQYHVALIVDKKITLGKGSSESWGEDGWRDVYSTDRIEKGKINSSILGAISIYPLKEMFKEMLEIERGSGDIAHPIFDNKGIVRWPRE